MKGAWAWAQGGETWTAPRPQAAHHARLSRLRHLLQGTDDKRPALYYLAPLLDQLMVNLTILA